MAKGNDGNYLQHSIEVALAGRLAAMHPHGRLHVAFAHGMAPFEPCEEPTAGLRTHLRRALSASYRPSDPGESPIVSAYRATGATLSRYPNSAELVRRTVGTDRLSGGITEVDGKKYEELVKAWSGTAVVPRNSSWRAELVPGGVLDSPPGLDRPWLLTLDPMTYKEDGAADDDQLYRADLPRLAETLKRYRATSTPGAAALFVYSVHPPGRSSFWQFADDLAVAGGISVASCWLIHKGGNRNLAALFCSGLPLAQDEMPAGVNWGRD